MGSEDDDLVERIVERQIRPQLQAAAMRDVGVEVDIAFVYVGDEVQPESVDIVCEGCGLRGQVSVGHEPPEGTVVLCSDCLTRLGRRSS